MQDAAQRKYVLTKLARGDYLLPSNDGKTLWRVRTYEDGPSFGLDWPRDLTLWALYRWTGPIVGVVDVEDWDLWENGEDGFRTRAAAIRAVLLRDGSAT